MLQNPDGTIEVLIRDLSLGEIELMIQANQIASGIPVSACIKDTLASLENPIPTEVL
jgi:hypothetical protein